MRSKSRTRRQRVVLRGKHRVEVQRRMKILGLTVGLVVGGLAAVKALSQESSWSGHFIKRHTPLLEMKAPETLSALPLLREPRPAGFGLWFPHADWRFRKRWMKAFPALGGVRFEKRFMENRVIVHLEPRIPLVQWEGQGVDKEGTVFELASERWTSLPKAMISSRDALPAVGPWVAELTRRNDLWNRVVAISQDRRGEMWLNINTGAQVAWGVPDVKSAPAKAQCLVRVLNDASTRLSGAATADMRFFEEGRVIVRPKSAI